MEAWILHIREAYYTLSHKDTYSVWSTEKQAYKAAAQYLKLETMSSHMGPMAGCYSLQDAVKVLLEFDKIKEAVGLVNTYTVAVEDKSSKLTIKIIQSKFLGSAFE